MWAKIKAAFLWVYNWITVLVAALVGVPELLLQFVNAVGGVDLSPLFGPTLALQIVTAVAVAKAVLALIVTKIKAGAAPQT